MPTKKEAALAWAARGFRVFPLLVNGTTPAWEGWTESATTNPEYIAAWWNGVDYNIGVCTTGMLVVDIDTKKGRDGLGSWMKLHGGFDTLTVRTRSGGWHLYYSGADVALSAGALGEGLDIRSHHGYVVAPGSVIDGLGYSVEIDSPVAPAPREIVALCKAPGERLGNATAALLDLDRPLAVHLATQAVAAAEGAIQGEQSEAAYRLACAVRDCGVSEVMAAALMDEWAARCSPAIGHDDLRGRVANAYAYAQNPGGAKNPEAHFSGITVFDPPPAPAPVSTVGAYVFGNTLPISALEARPWVMKRLLLRREITALIAPGGVGKSLLSLLVSIHLALGVDFMGYENALRAPAKSIIYNAEDSLQEMSMRLHALCLALNIDATKVLPFICLISGKSHFRLRLVNGGQQPTLNEEAIASLMAAASDPDVALLSLDPLGKLHTVNGIDNSAMTFVMDALEMIAERTDTAMLLLQHTSKPSGPTRMAGNADASLGASAIINSARIALTLTAPADEDAARFGLSSKERRLYLRLDDAKMNRTLAGDEALWMRKVPVRLWTGEEVGGLEQADMHKRTEHMRQMVGGELRVAMDSAGSGSMKLLDAAKALKASGGLFAQLTLDQLKQRIQGAMVDPITVQGAYLRLVDGSVVME